MDQILSILGSIASIVAIIYALYQRKRAITAEKLRRQSMFQVLQLSRSLLTPYDESSKIKEEVKDYKNVLLWIMHKEKGIADLFRLVLGEYASSCDEISYLVINNHIRDGMIKTRWQLDHFLRYIPHNKRSKEKDKAMRDLLSLIISDVEGIVKIQDSTIKESSIRLSARMKTPS